MTDLVVVSLEPWDEVWRRNQHLVAGLLREERALRVLFVEPATDPLHAVRHRTPARRGRGLRPAAPLPGIGANRLWLYEATKSLPRRLDPGFDRRWARRVERAARAAGLRSPLLWVNSPSGAHVLEAAGWPALYDVTDDWLAARRSRREHDRLVREEGYLLEHCSEVVVCSPSLLETMHDRGAERVTLVPNAVDVEAYREPAQRPADLPAGPVAVYVGTMHRDRLDVGLCEQTAQRLAGEGRLVLVGPNLLSVEDQARLSASDVLMLGPKNHDDVPAYLTHADVLVVPHVVDDFTDSLDPIKVYEYLAASRPIVSTPVAGFRELRESSVTVTAAADFPGAVHREALAPSPTADGLLDRLPTWRQRVTEMQAVIGRMSMP